jgi:hypothetical protein
MSVQEYLLREPARKLAKARGISEREAMQELKDKSDQLQRMTAIGVGVSGGGTAPRGLPERSLGTSPRGMRGTINGVKGTGAPRSPVAEALDLPPKIEKPSTLPSKPAVRGIEKPAYEPVAENPPDKQVFDYRKRAFDAAKEREASTIPSKPQPEPPSQQAWDNRQQAYKRAKEIINQREGGPVPPSKSSLDDIPEGYRLSTRKMLEINRNYKTKLAEKAKAVRESKKTDLEKSMQGLPRVRKSNMDMAEISDPNVPEPVKIRDVKKYNEIGEKVKQGIRKRKQE